ncbi:hypothetical protein J6590_018740 [Homalodisca vitripennis]|nr:hypothetical protein J6590_018740 [Homalodisca vitripennis]
MPRLKQQASWQLYIAQENGRMLSDLQKNEMEKKNLRKKMKRSEKNQPFKLSPAYTRKLPLTDAKIKDLNEMCRSGVIPITYHTFYQELLSISDSYPNGKERKSPNSRKEKESKSDEEDESTFFGRYEEKLFKEKEGKEAIKD